MYVLIGLVLMASEIVVCGVINGVLAAYATILSYFLHGCSQFVNENGLFRNLNCSFMNVNGLFQNEEHSLA